MPPKNQRQRRKAKKAREEEAGNNENAVSQGDTLANALDFNPSTRPKGAATWVPKAQPSHASSSAEGQKPRQGGNPAQAFEFNPSTRSTGADALPPQTQASHARLSEEGRLILVAGPPAAGKGTQCKRLAAELGLVHVSLGDIYRDAVARGTELGMMAQEYIDRGDFVADELTVQLVRERLADPGVRASGCLLDGFPRTAAQAKSLRAECAVDRLILLELCEDFSVVRALERRLDPETGAIYNLTLVPPPEEVIHRLVTRDTDASEDLIRTRLHVYAGHLEGILSEFGTKVQRVDASRPVDRVFNDLLSLITGPSPVAAVRDKDDWSDDEAAEQTPSIIDPAALIAAPCAKVGDDGGEVHVAVTINTPPHPEGPRVPSDICCLVDISGSMSCAAKFEENGVERDDGLNLLDIAKHAVKTVIHTLQQDDRFTLVAFDNHAETTFALDYMTDEGKRRAAAKLDTLQPRGATWLWNGIFAAMEALRAPQPAANRALPTGPRHRTLLLLTDGIPSDTNHIPQVKAYKEDHPDFRFQMNTFGFGYRLQSDLLLKLACEGNGTFSFVPDALILGTCFVNCSANALTTLAQTSKVHLTAKGGARLLGPVLGDYPSTETSWGRVIDLGPLQYGQSRELVVPMHVSAGSAPYLEVSLEYGLKDRISAQVTSREVTIDAMAAESRCDTVTTGYRVLHTLETSGGAGEDDAASDMRSLVERVQARSVEIPDPRMEELVKDVSGRMTKAIQGKDRFNRWGKHYLRALTRAHQVQVCTNFMDAGLQVYGGARFKELRSLGDDVFVSLPMPKPKPKPAPTVSRPSQAAVPCASPAAATYYAGGGGG